MVSTRFLRSTMLAHLRGANGREIDVKEECFGVADRFLSLWNKEVSMTQTADSVVSGTQVALANVFEFLPQLGLFLLILIVGFFISKWVAKAVNAVLERVGDHEIAHQRLAAAARKAAASPAKAI